MRRLLLACLVFLAALPALAATVTTKYSLTNAGWTDLGAGPLLLSFTGSGGVYAIGDAAPTTFKNEGFTKARGGSVKVQTSSHVWGTTKDAFGVSVYVAPITGGGGSAPPTSVWSTADAAANGMTLSNGGLTVTGGAGSWASIRNTISKSSGKMYVEFNINTAGDTGIGLANAGFVSNSYMGTTPYSALIYHASNVVSAGFTSNYTSPQTPVTGDVWALAVDFAAGSVWVAQNNVWLNASNPSTGTLPVLSFVPATVGGLFAGASINGINSGTMTLQPTAASQKYAPPSGFSAWDP